MKDFLSGYKTYGVSIGGLIFGIEQIATGNTSVGIAAILGAGLGTTLRMAIAKLESHYTILKPILDALRLPEPMGPLSMSMYSPEPMPKVTLAKATENTPMPPIYYGDSLDEIDRTPSL
jgi:hypothetical protein